MSNTRFIEQANRDYIGVATRIARHTDRCGEEHVVIEMVTVLGAHYLGWTGAEFAPEPDEYGEDVPFDNLSWTVIE